MTRIYNLFFMFIQEMCRLPKSPISSYWSKTSTTMPRDDGPSLHALVPHCADGEGCSDSWLDKHNHTGNLIYLDAFRALCAEIVLLEAPTPQIAVFRDTCKF